jgi:hypothetical protein
MNMSFDYPCDGTKLHYVMVEASNEGTSIAVSGANGSNDNLSVLCRFVPLR